MTGDMSNWHNIWKNKNKVENDMAFKEYMMKCQQVHSKNGGTCTSFINDIEFELPYEILGKLFE